MSSSKNGAAGSIVIRRQKKRAADESDSDYDQKRGVRNESPGAGNMKRRDAIARGEAIDFERKKKPGRPKMTSSEKERARQKRIEKLRNGGAPDTTARKEKERE